MANGYINIANLYKRVPVLTDTNGDHLIAVSDLRTAIAMAAAETGEVRPMPCKIGDNVYKLDDYYNIVDEMTVTEVGINGLFASMESVPKAAKRSSYLSYATLGDEWYMGKEDAYRERDRRVKDEQRKAD